MKFRKLFLPFLGYYVLGNVGFNFIFSITKTLCLNWLGGKENFVQNLYWSFAETVIFYTALFLLIAFVYMLYKKNMVNKLNQRLNQIKERSGKNEK